MNLDRTISVAMTTYNGEQYIQKQLDSILNQTYLPIEIVICDDCSTDNTWSILEEYSNQYPIIKIFRNNKNLGFKKNFEKVIRLCKGNFIALSDQDDIWLSNHLYTLIDNIGDNSIACGDAKLIDATGLDLGLKLSSQAGMEVIPINNLDKAFFIFYNRGLYQGASMLLSKDFLDIALPIPEGVQYHDVWFSFLACFTKGLNNINECITLYRQHGNNSSGNHIQVINKIEIFLWHLFSKGNLNYRHLLIKPVIERVQLTNKQLEFMSQAESYCKNRLTFRGRVQNAIFEIVNFRTIYGTKDSFIQQLLCYILDRINKKNKQ